MRTVSAPAYTAPAALTVYLTVFITGDKTTYMLVGFAIPVCIYDW